MPGYICEDLTLHFLLMDFKKLTTNDSSSYSFEDHFKHTQISRSLFVYLLFSLWFNLNLDEVIKKKKKKEKEQHDTQ